MSEESKLIPMFQQNKTFTTEVRGVCYEHYLTGPIGAPDEYIELCHTLRNASPQDEIIIRINSRGGFVSSERMIVNSIRESQATVRGFIEYDCMSAATGIFLACHIHGWAEHIQFMAHCSWWGAIGKNPDIKSQTEFGLKQMEEEIESTYSGLLNEEEIIQCNEGKEFWFGAKELETRMGAYYEYMEAQGCGDENCESCGVDAQEEEEQFSLEDMMADVATKAVDQAVAKLTKKYDFVPKAPKPKTSKKVVDKSVEEA